MDASKQPSQLNEAIIYIYMDNDFFKDAENGDMRLFNKYIGDFRCLVDQMLNTTLHIHTRASGRKVAKTEFSMDFVQQLVAKSPLLLQQRNAKEEIPLHIAAANGNYEVVEFIVRCTKELERLEDPEKATGSEASSRRMLEMLRMEDVEGNTPLHKAAESGSSLVVKLLMKELDSEFSFSTNKRGETPLYLASKRGADDSVAEILNNCKSMSMDIDYCGPDGTTALHAAVMSRDDWTTSLLMESKNDLIGKTDNKGRTPLHYAAHLGETSIVSMLLGKGASAAYIRDKERGSTALHMAAWQGKIDIMEVIIEHCPSCCEIVDKNGWNFLHFYFVTLWREEDLERLLKGEGDDYKFKNLPMIDLLCQKDINKITPCDVFSLGPAYRFVVGDDKNAANRVSELFRHYDITLYRYLTKEKQQIWESLKEISTNVLVAGIHVDDSFFENKEKEEEKKKQREVIDKFGESHLVVLALIATVTFAAAFTIPGGYNQDKGTAIMSHDSAFQAFFVTNTFAFVSSLLAIFLHFLLTYFRLDDESTEFQFKCILVADGLTLVAMIAMVIAFSTGSYAVLRSSLGFAIATCTLALTSIPCLFLSLFYLWKKLLQ